MRKYYFFFFRPEENIHRNNFHPQSDSLPSTQSFQKSSWHLQCILALVHVLLLIFSILRFRGAFNLFLCRCFGFLHCAPQNKLHFSLIWFSSSNQHIAYNSMSSVFATPAVIFNIQTTTHTCTMAMPLFFPFIFILDSLWFVYGSLAKLPLQFIHD